MIGLHENEGVRLAQLRESLRTGLWFVPSLFIVGAVVVAVVAVVTVAIDRHLQGSPTWLAYNGGPSSAQQILVTVATSMMTFTDLVFTITVGAVFVPGISVTLAILLVMSSLVTFVYYVNHITQSLRVVNIIESVAQESRDMLRAGGPTSKELGGADCVGDRLRPDEVTQTIAMEHRSGVLTSIDADGLVELARHHGCVLRLVPDMGDDVAQGEQLVEVYGGDGTVAPSAVLRQLGVARVRTMRQDLAFGFRQLVDIAEKALSPTLNDPTTAVQAIDRIHDLLRRLALWPSASGTYRDGADDVRFVRDVMTWSGFVSLAYEEIREYGASSVQVHRRLRASIEALLGVVPDDRRPPLDRQLRLLEQSAARFFPDAEERLLVLEADDSGLGNERNP